MALPLAVALLAFAQIEPSPAPRRLRLFDAMEHARFEESGAPAAGAAAAGKVALAPPRTIVIDLAPGSAVVRPAWLARKVGRDAQWFDDAWQLASLQAEGGVSGGALRIGPGLPEDGSFLSLLVEAKPQMHYVLRGRVRLDGHPAPDESSAREVARLIERSGHPKEARGLDDRWPSQLDEHRATRQREPGGWDRFEIEIPLSHTLCDTLEIRLLHKSGGSDGAATWFDDLELKEEAVDEATAWERIIAPLRPQDRDAAATPWRLRATLPEAGGAKETTKDAVLLPPGRRLSLPLQMPSADSKPQLRFACGMLPECFGMAGDGAFLDVTFTPEDAGGAGGTAPIALATVAIDPKNDAAQRQWLMQEFDLSAVAGRRGTLTFATRDEGDRDPFDGVVLATPRIEPADEPAPGWNVLLIASDTLRADRLSAFGYSRPTTPNLERLAHAGVRFTQARSQAPWTLPSFSSILTSQYPSQHGAGRGGHDEWTPLEPGVTTLAGSLARVGYTTVGITSNHLISPEYRLDQGFESYAVPGDVQWRRLGLESVEIDAPLVVDFVERHRAAPFFLFWHLMDPHLPYTTDSALRAKFTAPDYDGRFGGPTREVPFRVLDPRPGRRWFTHEGPPKPPPLSDADKQFVSDYYDAEVAEIDRAIGLVLDALERTGQWERTIVALIADHGEGLGDHGHYHHGYTLYDDQVHIPLIVRIPGGEQGATRPEPVQAIDLAPTLLSALHVPVPPEFAGVDLLAPRGAAGDGNPTDPPRAVFLEYPSYDSSAQKGVVMGRFKYLHDPWFHTESLFDVVADPAELKDVLADHPDVASQGRALLDAFRWEHLQRGRFHFRLHGKAGQRLRLALSTDDLFDANFAARPAPDERDFSLDFGRQRLVLDTTLTSDRFELVCWCRGDTMRIGATLDGAPLAVGLRLGAANECVALPFSIARGEVPAVAGETLAPPRPGEALFWMEPGAGNATPVVPSPEELEMLRRLGYAH
jgi:arylsulfatase A-like enzyme